MRVVSRQRFLLCAHAFALSVVVVLNGCSQMTSVALNRSGMKYFEDGYYDQARAEFARAVAENPQNATYMSNLAHATEKSGDLAAAEQIYQYALNADPGHQPAYHGLADLLVTQGRNGEAAQILQRWAATEPYRAEPHVEMAWLQRQLGDPVAASQSLQQALNVNPAAPNALTHLGQYYEDMGQKQTALNLYQQSVQTDWNQPQVHNRISALGGKPSGGIGLGGPGSLFSGMAGPNRLTPTIGGSQFAHIPSFGPQMAQTPSPPATQPSFAGAAPQFGQPNPSVLPSIPTFAPSSPNGVSSSQAWQASPQHYPVASQPSYPMNYSANYAPGQMTPQSFPAMQPTRPQYANTPLAQSVTGMNSVRPTQAPAAPVSVGIPGNPGNGQAPSSQFDTAGVPILEAF